MCNTCVPLVSKLTQKVRGYKEMFIGKENNHLDIEEEDKLDWWKAGESDGYDLQRKLKRVGCRPIYRKYMQCTRQDEQNQFQCSEMKEELNKCLNMLQFVYATKSDL